MVSCLSLNETKEMMGNTKVRGAIHVLLVGDPSTGKSQLVKAVQRAVCPGLYVSGKGSSAAGLTASVERWVGRFFGCYTGRPWDS